MLQFVGLFFMLGFLISVIEAPLVFQHPSSILDSAKIDMFYLFRLMALQVLFKKLIKCL